MKNKINLKENQIVFWLNSKTYPLEAVYSAAYVFLDQVYVYLDGDPKKEIIVSLKGKKKLNKKQIQALRGEFCNELLNYVLRVEMAKRNQKVRDFIVGTALVSATPTEILNQSSGSTVPEGEISDWQDDPLDIVVPWEEKYGKNKKTKKRNKKKKCK
jgi:His-Xaa-Ser system protein HxsD